MAGNSHTLSGFKRIMWPLIAVVCLVAGLLIGKFVLTSNTSVASIKNLGDKDTIAADKLDTVIATYTYAGKTSNITVKDVLELSGNVDGAKQKDGSYPVPAADGVLAAARTQIVLQEAENQGIKISDKELDEYTTQQLGSADYETLAKNYKVDVDVLKKLIREQAMTTKLREKATGLTAPTAPSAPTKPSDDNKDKATEDYAKYIIKLAGDQWDAKKNSWKDEAGSYAAALANYNFDGKTATYEVATIAYKTAMTEYSAKSQEITQTYQKYFNSLFAKATLSLSTLVIRN